MNKISLIFVLVLTACGGGGGGSSSDAPSNSVPTATVKSDVVLVANQSGKYTGVQNWAVGDLNGDGLDDVVIGGWNGATGTLRIFMQNTDGTMADKTSTLLNNNVYSGSQHIFIADFDKDGIMDIWVPGFNDGCIGGCSANSLLLWGNRNTAFTRQDFTQPIDSHGACVADINNDGYLDMIVRTVYVQGQYNGGYYINNQNRTFTFNSNNSVINGGSTCSVAKQTNNRMAILESGVNGGNSIVIVDTNLNLVNRIPVTSHSATATDLIDSIAMDVNGDGALDFVLVYNHPSVADKPGTKEVWLNYGHDSYAYAYTIDSTAQNQYSMLQTTINGAKLVMFDAPNGNAQLFRVENNTWTPYNQSKFNTMATQVGGEPGVNNWSILSGLVYANRNTGQVYMMQNIKGLFYTQSM